MGKLSDRRYEMLSFDYEKEQQELEIPIKRDQGKTYAVCGRYRPDEFLSLVYKHYLLQKYEWKRAFRHIICFYSQN